MERSPIKINNLAFDHSIISKRWLLLTAGEFAPGKFNSMTISWGSVGEIWNKPFFQVVVRPQRYTREFMESSDCFTLCVFPEASKPALSLLGSKSGRDCDKIKLSGLTPIASTQVASPGYDEAELIIECRKMYWQDIDPAHFLDSSIEANYANKDYHRAYFGEIVAVSGTDKYRRKEL
jgi:flavin reductase (DIM6/NTAB) family NADH-FMN oxidoreductase RutF